MNFSPWCNKNQQSKVKSDWRGRKVLFGIWGTQRPEKLDLDANGTVWLIFQFTSKFIKIFGNSVKKKHTKKRLYKMQNILSLLFSCYKNNKGTHYQIHWKHDSTSLNYFTDKLKTKFWLWPSQIHTMKERKESTDSFNMGLV